jgi:hypothetical protein
VQTTDPEFLELKRKVAEHGRRLSNVESQIEQLKRTAARNIKQAIWQFVAFIIVMATIIILASRT